MNGTRPILVTGSHRSGTTWAGRVLATSSSTAYVHEPFFPVAKDGHPALCDSWFTYVCEDNEVPYYEALKCTLDRAAQPDAPDASLRRPVIKDPLAIFSAAWLSARFETGNVVLIRHPAAFAGSLKARGWTHPFAHFLRQPLLMRDHLEPFARDLMRFSREEHDIVDQAALLWRMIHFVILKFREQFADWIYVRHEDLSRQPLAGFQAIFQRLGLDLSLETERTIARLSSAQPGVESPAWNDLERHSLSNIDTWKTRLSLSEIDRLKSQVSDISTHFYSEDEW